MPTQWESREICSLHCKPSVKATLTT